MAIGIQRFEIQHRRFGYKVRWFVRIQRFDGLVQRFDGFVIDKSGILQTICQTIKYHQTISNHIYGLYGYIYHRYKGLSIYRPIPGSHILRRSMSHIMGWGAYMAGYIRDTKPYLLTYTNHTIGDIRHMRLYGLK